MKKEDSLANRYMQYAMSTASNDRSNQLAALSQGQFMAIPIEKRDVAWIGHCISRCPGYKIEADMMATVTNTFRENYGTTNKKARQFNSHLQRNPNAYAAPFPVMWLEWEGDNEGEKLLYNGIIVEKLNSGIRVTFCAHNPESGLWPTLHAPISVASGTPKYMHTSRIYPKDTPAYLNKKLLEKKDSQFQEQMMKSMYEIALCALTALNSEKDIKLVPATEFVNQQNTIEDGHSETLHTMKKPLGLLTFKRFQNLELWAGDIIKLMQEEQQELASMMKARKSPKAAPVVTPNSKPSKPKHVRDAFTKSQETSLAEQVIHYGLSTGSDIRNTQLSELSPEELLAIPQMERDHAWFAHCIQKSDGYAGSQDIINAIAKFEAKTYSDNINKSHIIEILSKKPELYTPPPLYYGWSLQTTLVIVSK